MLFLKRHHSNNIDKFLQSNLGNAPLHLKEVTVWPESFCSLPNFLNFDSTKPNKQLLEWYCYFIDILGFDTITMEDTWFTEDTLEFEIKRGRYPIYLPKEHGENAFLDYRYFAQEYGITIRKNDAKYLSKIQSNKFSGWFFTEMAPENALNNITCIEARYHYFKFNFYPDQTHRTKLLETINNGGDFVEAHFDKEKLALDYFCLTDNHFKSNSTLVRSAYLGY